MTTVSATLVGALRADHPRAAQFLAHAAIIENEAIDRLAALGQPLWLSWVDPRPPGGSGLPVTPGHVRPAVYWQNKGYDPQPGHQSGTCFKTTRRHLIDLGDDTVLDLPVWRPGQREAPHSPACESTCDECGTEEYWLLPQYVWPRYSPGMSDPTDPSRIAPVDKVLIMLGERTVQLTPSARYSMGATGRPLPDLTGVVTRISERPLGDFLYVTWPNDTQTIVSPNQVTRLP